MRHRHENALLALKNDMADQLIIFAWSMSRAIMARDSSLLVLERYRRLRKILEHTFRSFSSIYSVRDFINSIHFTAAILVCRDQMPTLLDPSNLYRLFSHNQTYYYMYTIKIRLAQKFQRTLQSNSGFAEPSLPTYSVDLLLIVFRCTSAAMVSHFFKLNYILN